MGIEIERKFLLANDDWREQVERSVRMAQGYLNDAGSVTSGLQQVSMRVRIAGDAAHLNIKSREAGPSRQEFEYAIPLADADALLKLCAGGLIDKRRHYVRHEGHLWEVDEFAGDNAGLLVAEIELISTDEAFARPAWLGKEVTELPRYYNLLLAQKPFSQWSDEEKQGCS
jgi:adenylate cyclase